MKKRKRAQKGLAIFLAMTMSMQPVFVHAEELLLEPESIVDVNEADSQEISEDSVSEELPEGFFSTDEIIIENVEDLNQNETAEGAESDYVSLDEVTVGDEAVIDLASEEEGAEETETSQEQVTERLLSANAEEDFIYQELNGTYAVITDYLGASSEVAIPSRIGEYIVQEIGENAFADNTYLTKVTFPETIVKIGSSAFQGCSSLQEIALPGSLTEIGDYAFQDCSSLTQLKLPDGLKTYGSGSFAGCVNLERINYPLSLEHGGDRAFASDVKLTRIEVPAGVKKLADDAFACSANFQEIILPEGLEEIGSCALYECTGLTELSLPSTLWKLNQSALNGCSSLTTLALPEGLAEIGDHALANCTGLTELQLPESIKTIGSWAMAGCTGLTSVGYPVGLISAGERIFVGCTSLKSMAVPEGVTSLPDNVFMECTDFTEIRLPSTLKSIGAKALYGCSGLTVLTLPEGLEKLGESALAKCTGLAELHLPDSITTLGRWAVADCARLASVNYPAGLTSTGYGIFTGCMKLKSITVPEGVTALPDNVFCDASSLRTISLPSTLEVIGESAFSGCSLLRRMLLPANVANIKSWAFGNCSALEHIWVGEKTVTIAVDAFSGCGTDTLVFHGTDGSYVQTWAQEKGYTFTTDDLEIKDAVLQGQVVLESGEGLSGVCVSVYDCSQLKSLGEVYTDEQGLWINEEAEIGSRYKIRYSRLGYTFAPERQECIAEKETGLPQVKAMPSQEAVEETPGECFTYEVISGKDIRLLSYSETDRSVVAVPAQIDGYTVRELAENLFSGHSELEKVYITGAVTKLGSNAFRDCSSLREIVLPGSLTEIGDHAFRDCSSLTQLELPDGLKTYGSGSFAGCVNLECINYPLSLEHGGNRAFEGDVKLTRIEVPTGVKKLADDAFSYSANFQEIVLPEGLEEIGSCALYECTGLTELSLPSTLWKLNQSALNGCSGLTELTIPEGLAEIGDHALANCTGLTELQLPESITAIGRWAMTGCTGLTSVSYPVGLTSAGDQIFAGCTNLKSMVVPEGVTSLPDNVFMECADFTEIRLPSTLKSIGASALYGCSGLSALSLPEGLENVGESALAKCTGLAELHLPDSITTLGRWAVADCAGLASVNYPAGLTSAGYGIFTGCTKLKSITVPESVTALPDNVFCDASSLRTISLPSTLEVIGESAFSGCSSLRKMLLPSNVTEMKSWTFMNCSALEHIWVGEKVVVIAADAFSGCGTDTLVFHGVESSYVQTWAQEKGYTFTTDDLEIKDAVLQGQVVLESGEGLSGVCVSVYDCSQLKSLGEVYTDEQGLWINEEAEIGSRYKIRYSRLGYTFAPESQECIAEKETGLPQVKAVPSQEAVEETPGECFTYEVISGKDIRLLSYSETDRSVVAVPAQIDGYTVRELAENLFSGHSELEKVYITGAVTKLGSNAFRECSSLREIVLPGSLTEIGDYAFRDCSSLTQLELPDGLKTYGSGSFAGCVNLEHINYPLSLEHGGDRAFEGDERLMRIEVSAGVKKLADHAFAYSTNFREILLPEGLEEIGACALYECTGLTELSLPSTLWKLNQSALNGCSGLTELTIPEGLAEIGDHALANCTGLTELQLPESIKTIGQWAMAGCTGLTSVSYPVGLTSAGDRIFVGCTSLKSMTVPEGVTSLPDNVFMECTDFTEIYLPSTLKSIGANALYGCSGLAELILPEELEKLGESALARCTGLAELHLPDSITILDRWAVADCAGLVSVNYPAGLTSTGYGIFTGCMKLKSITVPEGVTALPDNVFCDASSLRTVSLPSTLEVIGESAFSGCKGLSSLSLGDSLVEIKRAAFSNCEGLTSVVLPKSVEHIGDYVFSDCKNLSQIFLGERIQSIGEEAFGGCPVCLYVVLNSYAAKWAIDQGMSFRYYSTGNMDYSNYALDMSNSDFYVNADIACVNNYITMYLNYQVSEASKDAIDNKRLLIHLAPTLKFVADSLKKDGEKLSEYSYDETLLSIPVTDDSGQIQLNVKVLGTGKLSAYTTFDYSKENSDCSDMLGMVLLEVPTLTLDVPKNAGSEQLSVGGLTDPKESLKVFVDGTEVARTVSKNTGAYHADITLPAPQKERQKYVVRVEKESNPAVYAESTVTLNKKAPILKKFDMYYMANESQKVNLLEAEGERLSLSINPAYSFTFQIHFDNSETLKEVYVVGIKNGLTKKIEAEQTANPGDYIATGYFDEANPNYVPGKITLWYSTVYDGSEFTDDITLSNDELPESCKNAEVDVLENTDEETRLNIALQDGTVIPVEFRTYGSVTSAEEDLLGFNTKGKSKARAFSNSADENTIQFFIDKLLNAYGDQVKANVKDKVKENGVVVLQEGDDLIYVLWNGVENTVKKLAVQGGITLWIREETCYTTALSEAWKESGQFISLAETGYELFQSAHKINVAAQEIRNSTTLSDADKTYALNKIDELRFAYGALGTFKIVMSVAKPYIKAAVVTAYGPIAGLLVSVAIDYATDLAQNYLDDAFDYYAQGGKGYYFKWLIDPSGYVYEAVTANRIQGAKVTAYYKETPQSEKVLWNAAEDSQVNPLYSDSEGCYAWDTPEGYWQVVVEMDGYETWTSDWVSVPPVQDNINAALVSKATPEAEWVNVYAEYAELHFTKYMRPETVSAVKLLDGNNNEIPYTLSYDETKTSEDGTVYADTFKLIYDKALTKGSNCEVCVPDALQSYSGVACAANSYAEIVKDPCTAGTIEATAVDYGARIVIPVSLDSYDSDTKVTAVSAFPDLARIVAVEKTDTEGTWNVIVEGRMPGETEITIAVKGTDIAQTVPVTINMNKDFAGFEDEEHTHSWDEGKISRVATCTRQGEKIYTCSGCNEIRAEEIPVDLSAHTFVAVVDKAASCGSAGSRHNECTECGQKEAAVSIPATGAHTMTMVTDRAASCGAAGSQHRECTVCGYREATTAIPATGAHTMTTVTDRAASCGVTGSQHRACTVCGYQEAATAIPATGQHTFGGWATVQEATVLAEGMSARSCTVCGAQETSQIAKLTPTITLNATSFPLKVKQSTTKLTVSGLAAGDSVVSWQSSNQKIVKVNAGGKITAQKKTGKAVITITLASGLQANVQVKVQKGVVKTSKITNVVKSFTLKKGETAKLEPIITPITTKDKISYKSSNKKVAVVSKKGVITAKGAGKAKITVKSGSKKAVVTVTVPKQAPTDITGVKDAITLKKGKSTTLKPKLAPKGAEAKIKYKSSDKKIVTVTAKGKVTAKKKGTAVITITAGGIQKTCTVTVQ